MVNLYNFQREGVEFLKERKKALLLDEMGLGKTIQTLTAIKELNLIPLIVCPKSVIPIWLREADRLDIPLGTLQKWQPGQGLVVNYESLKKVGEWKRFNVLVLDEAHYIKNPKAKRTKEILTMKSHFDYRFALTGTPILNNPSELYTLLKFINADQGWSFYKFVYTFCYVQDARFGKRFYGLRNKTLLTQFLAGKFIRRTKKDVINDLPPKVRETYYVSSRELEDLAYRIQSLTETENFNFSVLTEIKNLRRAESIKKVPFTLEFAGDLLEYRPVIFTWFRDSAKILGEKLNLPVLTGEVDPAIRQRIIQDFQQGKDSGLVLTMGVGGLGLNLQCSSLAIFHDIDWVPNNVYQAEDRLHRIGQTEPVMIYYIVSKGSVDDKILETFIFKNKVVKTFEETLKQLKGGVSVTRD
jgi:SWI/SNF-related matrix-associated actin-dependent regulator 1 of chromatin subfamily A